MSLSEQHRLLVRLPTVAESGHYPLPDGPELSRQGPRTILIWPAQDITRASLQRLRRSPTGGCLADFIALAGASDDAIVKFATRWGPIGPVSVLCDPENDEPDFTEMVDYLGPGHTPANANFPPEVLGTIGGSYEPIEGWREAARWITGILEAIASLANGDPLSEMQRAAAGAKWYSVEQRSDDAAPVGLAWSLARQIESDRLLVRFGLALWVQYAHFTPGIQWASDVPYPSLEFPVAVWGGLPTRLGLELLTTATSPTGIYRCDACGRPYSPLRRARSDRQHFCSDCSQGRSKAAKRAYYHRLKAKGESDG